MSKQLNELLFGLIRGALLGLALVVVWFALMGFVSLVAS